MNLLHEKSEVASAFKNFYSMIKTQYNEHIQILCSDNGTEFFNNELNQFFLNNGPYSPKFMCEYTSTKRCIKT